LPILLREAAENYLAPAEIWATISGEDWPNSTEPTRIFRGFVAGITHSKQRGQAQLVVRLTHDLFGLMQGTCLSAITTPGGHDIGLLPAIYKAFNPAPVTGAPGRDMTVFIAGLMAHNLFAAGVARDNLWLNTIRQLYISLAKDSNANIPEAFTAPVTAVTGPVSPINQLALDSLESLTSPVGFPLQLRQTAGTAQIAQAIATMLGQGTFESYATQTFWDKIVTDHGPSFLFAVTPRESGGYVIPYHPVLGDTTPYRTLSEASGISVVEGSWQMARPVQALGLYILEGLNAGTGAPRTASAGDLTSGVYYRPPKGFGSPAQPGAVYFRQGPPWMKFLSYTTGTVASQTGLPTRSVPSGGHFAPSTSEPAATRVTPAAEVSLTPIADSVDLMRDYAQFLWLIEQLQASTLTISGPLRFDIAPGSLIQVLTTPEVFSNPNESVQDQSFYGYVTRVTTALTAGSGVSPGQASTGLQLNYVRTDLHQSTPGVALPRHPLYEKVWAGGPLVADYAKDLV
jgi:hypothetical protein